MVSFFALSVQLSELDFVIIVDFFKVRDNHTNGVMFNTYASVL